MSDIRCPMCGKKNSDDQDTCKYCQARLKPLILGSDTNDFPRDNSLPKEDTGFSPDQKEDFVSDLPAWLQSLRSPPPDEPEPETLPDWLRDTRAPEADAADEEEIPDWLRNLRGESSEGEATFTDQGEPNIEPEQENIPDWLAGMRDTTQDELEVDAALEEPPSRFGDAELGWMDGIDSQPVADADVPEYSIAPFEEEGLDEHEQEAELPPSAEISTVPSVEQTADANSEAPTDWLGVPEDDVSDEQTDSVPEWLAGFSIAAEEPESPNRQDDAEQPPPTVEEPPQEAVITGTVIGAVGATLAQSEPAPEQDEIAPGWLDELAEGKPQAGDVVEAAAIGASEVPDWLSGFDENALPDDSSLATSDESVDALDLHWLDEERQTLDRTDDQELSVTEFSSFADETGSESLFSGELPEWLGEDADKTPPGETALPPGEKGDDLVQADLPSWLESMRPIESAALPGPVVEPSDKQVEGTGPLAGLRSVLPSEFEIGARSAPAAYTVKLQLSETQKSHASIIESLIKSEGEAGEISGRRTLGPQQLLLIGIFTILLVALLWPLLAGSQSAALPDFSTEAFEVSNAIGNLPAFAPVLLAVDYEPGLSGEMEATASAVLDHLMLKGAYLTLVSTSPTGPAQAERLVNGASERGVHTYDDASTYANLGYLPGGIVGIRSFAESPRRVMPFALDGTAVWDSVPLAEIQELSDFAMVLVITESPYTARSWIEQVKPMIGEKPLVMVVSAQAEPAVRPYFEGNPRVVQGIVAGLPGGASYESMIGRANLARNYWDAYGIGISLIAILLLVGGVASIILHFTTSQQPAAGGAKR